MKKLLLLFIFIPLISFSQIDKMKNENKLIHLVFVKFKDGVSIDKFKDEAYRMLGNIEVVDNFQFSLNVSPEGYDRGFKHAFSMEFKTEYERDSIYLPHPKHIEFGSKYWKDYIKDWMVYDYWKGD